MVETDDDLDVFFDPDAFGSEVSFVSTTVGGIDKFNAIFDEAHTIVRPGTNTPDYVMPLMAGAAQISTLVFMMICKTSDIVASGLEVDSVVTIKGANYTIVDFAQSGSMTTVPMHKYA